jgi:hypothetical protein
MLSKWKTIIYISQSLYPRMRITSKTVHNINKMEGNFELRYVFTYPGIISRGTSALAPGLRPSCRVLRSQSSSTENDWDHQS